MNNEIDELSGMTPQELAISEKIKDIVNDFTKLESYHQDHLKDFVFHIHGIQRILSMRIVKRLYPEYWNGPKPEKNKSEV